MTYNDFVDIKILQSFKEFIDRPIFGSKDVPTDASVDPTLFPEKEYPVYCPKCTYRLSGLHEQRCPECGTPYNLGKLIVHQYCLFPESILWKLSRLRKIITNSMIIGMLLCCISVGGIYLLKNTLQHNIDTFTPVDKNNILLAVYVGLGCLWLGASFLFVSVVGFFVFILHCKRYFREIKIKRQNIHNVIIECKEK